jgi:hypothetical protein
MISPPPPLLQISEGLLHNVLIASAVLCIKDYSAIGPDAAVCNACSVPASARAMMSSCACAYQGSLSLSHEIAFMYLENAVRLYGGGVRKRKEMKQENHASFKHDWQSLRFLCHKN